MKPKKLTSKLAIDLIRGEIYLLGYNHHNKGMFSWKHQEISLVHDEIRLVGQYRYPEMEEFSKLGDYLYEFMGIICRGSGAEPLFILNDNHSYPDQIISIGEEYTDVEKWNTDLNRTLGFHPNRKG